MDKRQQINIRVADDRVFKQIEDLRRWRSPIPTITDLIIELIDSAHERESKRRKGNP